MLPGDGLPAVEEPLLAPALAPAMSVRGLQDVFVFHDPCVLGTHLNLMIRARGQVEAYAAACGALAEIHRLKDVFNWRSAASEISALNTAGRMSVSPDLFAVIAAAERWRVVSSGAVSGRMGLLLDRWRAAGGTPDRGEMEQLARQIASAEVTLDLATRTIVRPEVVRFDLDAIAKGYIVDRALAVARETAGVCGALADIGGDIGCAGDGPDVGRWRIEVPEPLSLFDNAPACGAIMLGEGAVATSGCGPRDVRANARAQSPTIDPRTGWPVAHRRSATAVAPSALAADALATAMLVLGKREARSLLAQLPDMSARVAGPGGAAWLGQAHAQWVEYAPQQQGGKGSASLWKQGWFANITFEAPPKDMRREIAFRSPYVAIWVSDLNDKPVRTLLLIGRNKEWHEGNHIWWRLNRTKVDAYFAGRSMSTRGSGTYKVYWDGTDDVGATAPTGKYRLHVETSRESGGHEHRVLDLDFSTPKEFESELPVSAQSGGLRVSFEKF